MSFSFREKVIKNAEKLFKFYPNLHHNFSSAIIGVFKKSEELFFIIYNFR